MSTSPIPSPYMTLEEAAAYIRQKPGTLDRWATDGYVDYIQTPTGRLFTAEVLDKFMHLRFNRAKRVRSFQS